MLSVLFKLTTIMCPVMGRVAESGAVQIDVRIGPAAQTLDALLAANERDSYDFAFIGTSPGRSCYMVWVLRPHHGMDVQYMFVTVVSDLSLSLLPWLCC